MNNVVNRAPDVGAKKNNFQSLTEKGRWLLATLTLIFTLGIGQMWGANGDVLFSQDFNSATAVSQNLGAAAVDIDKDSENNIFGNTAASQFTSLKAAQISNAKGGLAINTKVSSNSVEYDYSKKFGFRSDDTKASFHLVKKTNFATTAPTALKIEMTMYYQQLSSGSNVTASFAIGDSFNDKEKPANSNIHSGFTIKGNGTATFCQFGTTTNLTGYATKMTQGSEVEVTWVINNTGSTLKYTDPNGEESSLDNDKFDVWVGTTKNVAGAPATTASKSLQNLYIGDCDAKKKFEFYLNDIKVTDLTPCLEPSITTQPSGASLAIGDANPELSVSANNTTSYAWKESSDGTSYDGSTTLASTASFTPEVNDAVQTKYYYCELVNSCNASNVVKTNIVTVEVVSSATPVTGVSLDITSQEFTLGGTVDATLTATVAPNEATNKNISWESDKPLIVSVTDNGDGTADIKGLAEGTATITVTTQDGSFTATCDVTVNPDPCTTWGVGTSTKTIGTVGDLTLAWVGSASTEAAYTGSSDKYPKTNSGSNYIVGSLGGKVIESLTIGSSSSTSGSNLTIAVAFSSESTFNSSKLLEVSEGKTVHVLSVTKKANADGTERYDITVPAGAKSFAWGRNFSFGSPDGTYQNSDSRYLYYVHACPHICDGDDATQYAVSGTATICAGENTNVTLANSQSGAKYVLLKDNAEVDGSEKAGTTGSALVWSVSAAGTYTVKAIEYGDFCETAMTGSAVVTIKPATVITTQPVDADASVGIAQTFSVVATGAGTLEYQWQIKNGENWDDIENADEATYSVSKDVAGEYQFRCVVSGDCGDATSNVVTLTVAANILTVTYNANGGNCETPSATWSEGDDALVLPTATKANYDFIGWYDAATGGNKIASPYTPTVSIELFAHYVPKLVQAIYSNKFDAFIKNQAVTVYYMQGESEPTLTSIKVLGVETPVYEEVEGNIKVTVADVDYIFPVTKTAVAPYTYENGDPITFDGTETYIKSGYSFSTTDGKEGWRFSKNDNDWSRETPGNNRIYFFIGAAESITLTSGCSSARAMKVYRNGTQIFDGTMPKNSSSPNYVTLTGSNAPAMYAVVSNQTDGDGAIKIMALAQWVPTTAVVLREGEAAISEKEIWAGTNFTLTAEVTPDNASNKTITWTSSNDAVATVVNGVVTGVAANATPVTITATTVDGVHAECVVTVTVAPSPCETPTITVQPATQAYCVGSEPTLTVEANVTDGGTLHYAWFKDDAAIGSDAATCVVDGAGTYKVVVTNKVDGKLDASVTSANAVVTMNVAAAITKQPTNKRDIVSGASVTLSVEATNATGYQWYSCEDAEKHGAAAISGAEAANYVFSCNANGFYYCVVGNACGEDITSNVVSVKLEPEGCNTFASKPTAEPYNYEQTGEWTFYNVDSNGADKSTDNVFEDGKNFDNEDVVVANTRRFALKFEKDVESVTLYGVGGNDKSFTKVSVSDEMKKNTYTELTATATKTDLTSQQHIFTIEDMIIPAGKYAWFELSGSLKFFKICYTEALAEPVLPTLGNQELCAGAAYVEMDATITNVAACTGTVSYQWYNAANDEAIEGANVATFTPSAEGSYYVVVRHAAAGHMTREVKSANINVAHFDALAISSVSEDVFQHMGTATTLSVVATGKNVAYKWYTCEDAAGNGAVAIAPAQTEASLAIASILEGVHYYMVEVSHDCDATVLSRVIKVEGWNQLEQVDVTETTTWNMANSSENAIDLSKAPYSCQNEKLLLANIDGVNLNASFNSQALMFEGQHIGRTQNEVKHLAGRYLQFNVTKSGYVSVTFASNGSNARTIKVNGLKCQETSNSGATYKTFVTFVQPGSVEIIGMEGTSEKQYVRISEVKFTVKETPDYSRDVTYNIGTLCVDHNVVAGGALGATFYQIASRNEIYNDKIDFEEVLPNEELKAGEPYIFKSTTGKIELFYGATVKESPVDVRGMHGWFDATAPIDPTKYDMLDITEENKEDILYISSNKLWNCGDLVGVGLQVVNNRAYIKMSEVPTYAEYTANPSPSNNAPRRRVTLGKDAEQTTTGMENINASEQPVKLMINGQLFIIRGEKMFNANGQLVK